MSGVAIREARVTDCNATSAYMAALLAEGLDVFALPDPPPTPEQQRAFIGNIIETPFAFALLAIAGERVVGILDFRPTVGRKRTASGSFGMSLSADYRGQGLGRKFVEAMIERARRERPELCRIELEVVPWNARAIRLYEACGFKHEATKDKVVLYRGKPEALLLMARVW